MQYKIYKVYKLRQALNLIDKGNKVIYTEPNRNKPWLKVFCFIETDKLHTDWE